MNEISRVLEPKEKTIWDGKPKYMPYIISAFFGSIIAGGFFGLFAGTFLKSFTIGIIVAAAIFCLAFLWNNLSYKFTHYALTERRAVFQSGVFGRNFKSINYDDIKNASVSVGLFNWLFSTGSINIFTGEITSTGGEHPQTRPKYDTFSYISNPYEVLKELEEHLTKMEENLYGGKNVVQKVKVVE
jgi:hypothetical protein